ncbi:hypothetical protein EYA84_17395 [Verrucosispora sp. SN26_14.1]|nr:hypothetical protein EYA84_17395 [Verrucosispora sp. SN26_14.1]
MDSVRGGGGTPADPQGRHKSLRPCSRERAGVGGGGGTASGVRARESAPGGARIGARESYALDQGPTADGHLPGNKETA